MGFMCQIYEGAIKDEQSGSLSTYFYDQPTTDKRRSRYIYPTAAGGLKIVNMVELFANTGFEAFASVEGKGLAFVYPREYPYRVLVWDADLMGIEETQRILLSLYVIADFDTEYGLGLVKEALSSIVRPLPLPVFSMVLLIDITDSQLSDPHLVYPQPHHGASGTRDRTRAYPCIMANLAPNHLGCFASNVAVGSDACIRVRVGGRRSRRHSILTSASLIPAGASRQVDRGCEDYRFE